MSLEQLLADWRERATHLKASAHGREARLIDQLLEGVREALPEYLAWLSEADAMLYEGRRTPEALRDRFAELETRDLAKWDPRQRVRYYRRICLRHRGNPEAAREAGKRAGAA